MRLFLVMTTSPSSASSSPVSILKRVDFPAPFRPKRPTRSPVSTWKVIPSKMLFPISKDFFNPFTLISIMFVPVSILAAQAAAGGLCPPYSNGYSRR